MIRRALIASVLAVGLAASGHRPGPRLVVNGGFGFHSPDAAVTMTTDGRTVVVSPSRGPVRAWDVASGRVRFVTGGSAPALASDGASLAVVERGRGARVLATANGDSIREIAAPTLVAVAFSPTGDRLVGLSSDGAVTEWSLPGGRLERLRRASPGGRRLHVLADERTVLVEGSVGVELLELDREAPARKIGSFSNRLVALGQGPAATWVATVGHYGRGWVWSLPSGAESFAIDTLGQARFAVASPDGGSLLTGNEDGTTRLWDAGSGEQRFAFEPPRGVLQAVAFADGRPVALTRDGATLLCWAAGSGQQLFATEVPRGVGKIAVTADGSYVVGLGVDADAVMVEMATGRILDRFTGRTFGFPGLALDEQGGRLVLSGQDRSWLWSLVDPRPPTELPVVALGEISLLGGRRAVMGGTLFRVEPDGAPREPPRAVGEVVAATPDLDRLLVGRGDGSIEVIDAMSPQPVAVLQGPPTPVSKLAISRDGELLLAGYDDGSIDLWSVQGDRRMHLEQAFAGRVEHLALAPDAGFFAAAQRTEIHLRALPSGELISSILVSDERLQPLTLAFSPNGKKLVALQGAMLSVWDAPVGRLRHRVRLPPAGERWSMYEDAKLRFSSDGTRVAVAGSGGVLPIVDLASGEVERQLSAGFATVHSVLGDAALKLVVGGLGSGEVRLWDGTSGDVLASIYTFLDGSWVVLAPDGRWDASEQLSDEAATAWLGNDPKPLRAVPELRAPGLLAEVVRPVLVLRPPGAPPVALPAGPGRRPSVALAVPDLLPTAIVRLDGEPSAIAGGDGRVYLATSREPKLWILDVGDAATPRVASALPAEAPPHRGALDSGRLFAAVDDYANQCSRVGVINVRELEHPRPMGEIPCATDNPWVRGVAAGDGLLVAAGRRGLDVLAPSSTAAFERIGQLRPAGLTWEDVEVRDRLAFAVGSNATDGDKVMLGVVRLADPRQPVLRAAVSFGRRPPVALALSGDLVLVAAGDDGLYMVDVADPDIPRLAGRYDTPGAFDVVVAGSRVFVADTWLGLLELDVRTPSAPRLASRHAPRGLRSVAAAGPVLVATWEGGWVSVFDLATP